MTIRSDADCRRVSATTSRSRTGGTASMPGRLLLAPADRARPQTAGQPNGIGNSGLHATARPASPVSATASEPSHSELASRYRQCAARSVWQQQAAACLLRNNRSFSSPQHDFRPLAQPNLAAMHAPDQLCLSAISIVHEHRAAQRGGVGRKHVKTSSDGGPFCQTLMCYAQLLAEAGIQAGRPHHQLRYDHLAIVEVHGRTRPPSTLTARPITKARRLGFGYGRLAPWSDTTVHSKA